MNEALINAVERGNVEAAKDYLERGASANTRKRYEYKTSSLVEFTSVLYIAVENNDVEMTKLLMDNGANPSSAKRNETTLEELIKTKKKSETQNINVILELEKILGFSGLDEELAQVQQYIESLRQYIVKIRKDYTK